MPWGISESAYNVTDLEGNYQYRAFGVPGLTVDTHFGRLVRRFGWTAEGDPVTLILDRMDRLRGVRRRR